MYCSSKQAQKYFTSIKKNKIKRKFPAEDFFGAAMFFLTNLSYIK